MSKTSTFECTYILWTETDNSYEIKTINRPRPTPSELGDEWHISNYVAFQIEKQLRNGGMTWDDTLVVLTPNDEGGFEVWNVGYEPLLTLSAQLIATKKWRGVPLSDITPDLETIIAESASMLKC